MLNMKFSHFILLLVIGCFAITFRISNNPDHIVFISNADSLDKQLSKSFGYNLLFLIVDKIPSLKNKISTGEYIIKQNETSYEFLLKLINNNSVTYKITFPEGWTVYKIIDKINANKVLRGTIEKIPLEGSLMPDTYYYKFGHTKQHLLHRMADNMNQTKKKLEILNRTDLNMKDIIILASLIEQETKLDSERPIISSVYHNRLKKKMRLQCDPTVLYAVIKESNGKISKLTKEAFKINSPYNTYKYSGLPPTPICCPSKSSIIAAMNPVETNYLFFVYDSSKNTTYFSETFQQHIKYKNQIYKNKQRTT